ncbi:MAG TPA: histidine kinase, partial [Chloroflexota bacterium]|nr:histidine kinase [Chloroflexota bacterium]
STVAGLLSIAIENTTRYEESQAREALRGELLHQVVSVQERERQRIARDLHDGAGQALTALGLGFVAVSETVKSNPTLAAQQLVELKQMSTQALIDLRDLIRDLRPSLLDDLGLVPALQNQVQTFQSHN